LLTLREANPEDPEVNLELARIAAKRHDVTETLRLKAARRSRVTSESLSANSAEGTPGALPAS
jgi:hypothetical protein